MLDEAYGYAKRLKPIQAARAEMEVARLEARAIWGVEADEALKPLFAMCVDLAKAHVFYFSEAKKLPAGKRPESENPFYGKLYEKLYHAGEKDEFEAKVNRAVEKAETFFRQYLNRPGGTR